MAIHVDLAMADTLWRSGRAPQYGPVGEVMVARAVAHSPMLRYIHRRG
jgi:hypothetical protein